MVSRTDVLDAMQSLVLETGRRPSLLAVARAVGLTKQGVLHYFPDRASLDAALVSRAVTRVDDLMQEAAQAGSCAATYLRLSAPTDDDRAVALLLLTAMRSGVPMPPEVTEAVDRWQSLMADELGDPQRAEVVRLVGDGLFSEALASGAPPTPERLDRLVSFLLPPATEDVL